jgi:hypothetical protein
VKHTVRFSGYPYGRENPKRKLRVIFESDGYVTTCEIEKAGLVSGWALLSQGKAVLGKGDTFDFNAGCRIAFDRAWRSLDWQEFAPGFVKILRRAVQIELGIHKLDLRGQALHKALLRTAREYEALLALRVRDYGQRPKVNLDEVYSNLVKRLHEEVEKNYSQHHGEDTKATRKGEPMKKPDAYKATHESEAGKADFPVTTFPMSERLKEIERNDLLPCYHLIVGITDDILPPECAECAGAEECCAKHGGVA